LNELLNNKSAVLTWPSHGMNWERHEHSCLTTHFPLLYPHPAPSYASPKLGSSFCRTLYLDLPFLHNQGCQWNNSSITSTVKTDTVSGSPLPLQTYNRITLFSNHWTLFCPHGGRGERWKKIFLHLMFWTQRHRNVFQTSLPQHCSPPLLINRMDAPYWIASHSCVHP
jgi:hypothetical protein